MLSAEQLDEFERWGIVRVEGVFSATTRSIGRGWRSAAIWASSGHRAQGS
jgi:hypothetical protein